MPDTNMTKLRLIMGLFRIRPVDVSKATGYSRAYISRMMAGTIGASEGFYIKLNNRLPILLSKSGAASCVFDIQPTHVEADDATLKTFSN